MYTAPPSKLHFVKLQPVSIIQNRTKNRWNYMLLSAFVKIIMLLKENNAYIKTPSVWTLIHYEGQER